MCMKDGRTTGIPQANELPHVKQVDVSRAMNNHDECGASWIYQLGIVSILSHSFYGVSLEQH